MNQTQPRNTLNHIQIKNVKSVEGFQSPSRTHLDSLGKPKRSVIIVQEGPPDSKSLKESSKHEKQSHQEAALFNSQLIHLPIQTSKVEGNNPIATLLQPVTHSQLQNHNNQTYENGSVVQSTSIALSQLAKTVTQPISRPPLPPGHTQRLQNIQTNPNNQQSLNKIQAQNRLSPRSRPSSSVPTVVHFNYHQTQRQTPPPQQIKIVTFPTQNIQPVFISPSIPQNLENRTQNLINQNNQLRQNIMFWQQRYFTVIQRFQFCYQKIETITREYIIIHQKVLNCTDPHQLQLLKQKMSQLQHIISQTQQELAEAVNRNKQVIGDTTNWKGKYEQMVKVYSNDKSPQLLHKLQALQSHLSKVESDYKSVLSLNDQAHQNENKYIEQINRLNQILSKQTDHSDYQNELEKYRQHLLLKSDEINTLRMIVEAQKSDINNNNSSQYQISIQKLNQQTSELYSKLKQTQQELFTTKKTYQERINQYEYQLKNNTQEIKRFQSIIEQRGKADNMKKSQTINNHQISHDKDLEVLKIKHQLSIKQETQIAQRKMFNSKIQELTSAKDSTICILQQKASILESDLNKKDSVIRSLRDKVYELEQSLRIKNLDDKYQKGSGNSINNAVKSSGIHSAESSHQNDKQLHTLRNKLKEQNLKLQQVKGQVSEYKRLSLESQDALTAVKHQNAMLKKQIEDLNYKINQYKQTIRQLEQGRKAYNELKIYSDSLKQALHQKQKEILMLNHRIEDMQLMQKQTTKIKPPQLAQLAQFTQITQQNQMLEASIYKKDLQISKFTQNNQLLQNSYDQLEAEFQKISQKKMQTDKQYQTEKNQLKNKIAVLQTKSLEYQRKVVGLQEVRTILQQQLAALTAQLQIKIQNLQRSEIELKQEKSKNKTFESEIQSKMSQNQQLTIKLKQINKKYNNLIKQVQIQLDKKNEEINSKKNEFIIIQTKLFDLQTMLKTKQARIKELQKNNQNLKLKIGNIDNNLDQMKYLKLKITQYQSKVSALTYKATARLPNTEPTQIFQRKVIYQLKLQNQALKQQLTLINRPTDDNNNDQPPKKELKQRLTDFNQRLQEVIGQHFYGDPAVNVQNDMFKKYQRDRRQLIQKYNEEITQLKIKILELQSQPTDYKVTYSKGHYSSESIYNEQIQFYRQKNIQLEQRVQNHIKVNRDLKEQIQKLMRGHQDQYPITYYIQQLSKSNQHKAILQDKNKKLNLQIKKLREQLAKLTLRPNDTAQYEIRISQMNRKISQFVLQINELDRQKVQFNQLVVSLQQQVQKYKSTYDELRYSKEQISKQLQIKQDEMLNQTAKLNSRIKLLQSQIERLNQLISKRQNNQSTQLNLLRSKLNDSQEQNRKLKIKLQEYLLQQERNQRQINKWQTQIQSIQIQLKRYREQTEQANRKLKQTQTQIYSLRTTISDYQGKLRSKQSLFEDHNYLQNQLNQQITRLKSQIALLSQQLERVNEFSQKKISQKETEIIKIRQAVAQKQQQIFALEQQISQIRINVLRANQTNKQISSLEQQINRLNYALIVKNSEYERRGQEITDLTNRIKLTQQQIKQLRKTAQVKAGEFSTIISRLQLQLKTSNEKQNKWRDQQRQYEHFKNQQQLKSKQIEHQLTQVIRVRQTEINQLYIRLNQFQGEVQRLQADLRQMHSMAAHIQALQKQIANMDQYINQQKQYYQEQMNKVRSKVHESSSDRNNYQITINKLQTTITTLNLQINDLKTQLSRSQSERNQLLSIRSSLQIKITQLQQNITSYQLKITNLTQTISTLQLQIANLHQTITVREKQYMQLNSKYEQHVSQLQIQLQNFRLVINQLEDRLKITDQHFNTLIKNSQYSIELLRIILISVQTQLQQKQSMHEGVHLQINKGLEQCQRWNQIGL